MFGAYWNYCQISDGVLYYTGLRPTKNEVHSMNKTFKIVFNKARGALMVANEITGSVQRSGKMTFQKKSAIALMVSAMFVACAANAATTNYIDNTVKDLSSFHLKDYSYENLDYTTDNKHGVFDVFYHNKFSWDSFSEDKALAIENVVINNVKAVDSAALKNDGSNVILKNVSINNTTNSFFGALRLVGGLQYNPSSTIVRITEGMHKKYAGNIANANCNDLYSDEGGFAYLNGDVHLSFDIGENASLVIGEEGAYKTANLDSIATFYTSTINKTGAGELTLNGSLAHFAGVINATGGTLRIASTFGKNSNNADRYSTLNVGNDTWSDTGAITTLGSDQSEYVTVNVKQNGLAVLGTMDETVAQNAMKDAGFTLSKNGTTSAAYLVAGDTTHAFKLTVGNAAATTDDTAAGVTIGKNGLLMIDTTAADKQGETAIFKESVTNNGTIYLTDAKLGESIKLSESTLTSGTDAEYHFTGDRLLETSIDGSTIKIVEKKDAATAKTFEGLIAYGSTVAALAGNGRSAAFLRELFSSDNTLETDEIVAIANSAAVLGATTGVQTVTLDAVKAFADSYMTRTGVLADRAEGFSVWADVNGGRYEGKRVFDGAGYTSDIYAGTIGADAVFSCNARLGVAMTFGTADTNSHNTLVSTSTDTDYVGFAVYADKTFGDFNVAADLGYLKASNDVTAGYGIGDFSEDTQAMTFGVKGEILAKAGFLNVVPHIGVRYTHLNTDDFEGGYDTSIDSMDIWQLPIGVTFSGDIEAAGWTVAPTADFSVVPAFGDKKVTLKFAQGEETHVNVVDTSLFQTKIGVSAQKDAWGFEVFYKLGAGQDDRLNNTFNANVRYAF